MRSGPAPFGQPTTLLDSVSPYGSRRLTVEFDGTAPTVTVARASGQTEPTTGLPVRFAVTFSEPVFGFDASDVVVGGTAPGARTVIVTGSGSSYVVTVDGPTDTGTVTLSVKAGATVD